MIPHASLQADLHVQKGAEEANTGGPTLVEPCQSLTNQLSVLRPSQRVRMGQKWRHFPILNVSESNPNGKVVCCVCLLMKRA